MAQFVPVRPPIHYADLSKLVSRLKIPVHWRIKKLGASGPEERLLKLRKTVTALFKYERIELNFAVAEEARGYSERLISEAIKHGSQCPQTMEMANWWLEEKQLVHKLFKVIVPRFQHYPTSFTTLYTAPYWHFSDGFRDELNKDFSDREVNEVIPEHFAVLYKKGVIELKGHPYPPFYPSHYSNPRFIQNVLLSSAKDFFKTKPMQRPKDSISPESPAEDAEEEFDENHLGTKNAEEVSSAAPK